MNAFKAFLARVSAIIEALTPRERAVVAVALALAALVAMTGVVDWSTSARSAAEDEAGRVASAEAAIERESNRGYQEAVRLAAQEAEDRSVVEASEGVAQARAAGVLRVMADNAGLTNVVIATKPQPAAATQQAEITPLSLSLSADFTWPAYARLLESLATSDFSVLPEEIDVQSVGDSGQRLTMTVRAAFLKRAPQT